MARTQTGAQLTAEHKASQLALRAGALRSFLRLWPIWTGDEESFRLLVDATVPLIREQHRASAQLAASYFRAFRFAERPGGSARPVLADPPVVAKIAGTLYAVARDMTRAAVDAGQTPETAMRTALVRTSGSVGTLVLDGGRSTIAQSVAADRKAIGWARVASAGCCAFCAMLAARGAVYGESTGDFQAHDHCGCSAEPAYPGSGLPPTSVAFADIYEREAAGRPDALQVFRRALAAERDGRDIAA
ncbi:hypothetical protein [Patulibacter sp. SYSU D01012]|uniref:VG15 protein n=1 Tax=Patulibacter sp. SYSU D01012 TaxID=2817381 RepID=UPI001B308D12|nr:hypothetical protein [Patulibacter sp. SYSU D01012]